MNSSDGYPKYALVRGAVTVAQRPRLDLRIMLYLLIGSMPIELMLGGTLLTIPKILGAAALVLFVLSMLSKRLHVDRAARVFVIFFLFSVLSVFWSAYPESSLSKIFTVVQLVVFYVMIINEVDSRGALNAVMVVSIVGGAVLGASGLVELRDLASPADRMAGFSRNPNIYVTMAMFLIPAIYWCIRVNRSALVRLFSIAVMGILFITSLYTKSVGGLVALAVFLLAYFVFSRNKVSGFLLVVLVGALTFWLAPQGFWERVADIGYGSTNRFRVLWPAGWQAFRSSMLVGHGIGTSDVIMPDFVDVHGRNFSDLSVHNGLLALGIDLGLVGAALYVAVIVIPSVQIYKLCCLVKGRPRTDLEAFGVVLFCALLAYLASWFKSGGFEYFKYLWVLVGLESALVGIIAREQRAEP